MAKLLTPKDGAAILNLLVKDLTGESGSVTEFDPSSFVSAGETVMAFPTENVLNSLTMTFTKTLIGSKPRKSKFNLIQEQDESIYATIIREILVYAQYVEETGIWNTDKNTNFANGYDNGSNSGNSVGTMWEQRQPVTKEMFYGGIVGWDDGLTIYEDQYKQAFQSQEDWLKFVNAILVEKRNDIDRAKEAFNRMTFLNYVAGIYDSGSAMPGSKINLTEAFNTEKGTSYTTAQLLTTQLEDFLKFFAATVRQCSDDLEDETVNFHWTPTKTVGGVTYQLPRQTMKSDQRLILYGPLFNKARAEVLPTIFNPQYLDVSNAEMINFWQSPDEKMAINLTPAIPDFAGTADGEQVKGAEVDLPVFIGALFDKDACRTHYILDKASTTPLEARKHYRNTWWHVAKNSVNNFTKQGIIFYCEDPAPDPEPGT